MDEVPAAEDRTSLDAWRRRLRPWLRALHGNLAIDVPALPSRDVMRDVWVMVDASAPSVFDPQPWTVFMEALELLDLLVRVDPAVGWDLVFEGAHMNRAFAINKAALYPRGEPPQLPKYRILVEEFDIRENVVPIFIALSRLVDGAQDVGAARVTTAFHGTKRLLLDLWRDQHGGRAFDRETAGPIEIKPSVLLQSELKSDFARFVIHRTRQIAIASRPHARPSPLVCAIENLSTTGSITAPRPPNGRPFHLAAIAFTILDHDVTNELAYVLLDIHDRGLRVSELEVDQVFASQLHTTITSSFFTAMLDPSETRAPGDNDIAIEDGVHCRGLQRLTITSGIFDDDAVEAICTGIAKSQSLREVVFSNFRVRNQTSGQPLWWPWLAYALFGPTSCHQIESVSLDVREFNVSDIEAMRSTHTHPNPLAYLCSLDENGISSLRPMVATFKHGGVFEMSRRLTSRSVADATRGSFSINSAFPITRDYAEEDFVEFVMPSTGVCWTQRENILHQVEMSHDRRVSPIRHLKLERVGTPSQAAVVELLKLVGASVQRLTLVTDRDTILNDVFMDALCRSSPQLRRLDIDGDVASLRWLVSPPADARTRCKLENLSLFGHVVDTDSFLEFFQALSERNHVLTRTLRGFHFKKAFSLTHDVSLDRIYDQWIEMLLNNSTLERSELDVNVDDHQASAEALAARFRAHDGSRILMREALAFLSVAMPTAKGTETAMSMPRLHTDIARAILVMAKIPSRRICG